MLERFLFFLKWGRRGVYVINYHGTPKSVMNNFEEHLNYYMRHFHILDPAGFEEIFSRGKLPEVSKPSLLLTFDDGMRNNLNALKLLNEKHLKVYFFVIPAFIDSAEPEKYLASVIRPGYINPKETNAEDFMSMTWENLQEALFKGHKIGSHTYSHTLVKDDNVERSTAEIVNSKRVIEDRLSTEVPWFCSINNTDISIGKIQDDLIRQHYRYHFTTCFGHNFPKPDPLRIERINIEAYWNMNEVRFALGSLRKLMKL